MSVEKIGFRFLTVERLKLLQSQSFSADWSELEPWAETLLRSVFVFSHKLKSMARAQWGSSAELVTLADFFMRLEKRRADLRYLNGAVRIQSLLRNSSSDLERQINERFEVLWKQT